jgi:mono/diheme cytochrome c family protein
MILLSGPCATAAEKVLQPVKLGVVRREPVSATFWNEDLAVIACAKSGSLIFWDIARRKIKQEFVIGKQLRGVVRFGNDELLAIDDKTHELLQLRYGEQLIELNRYPVPASPVHIIPFGERCAVASLWARQVTIWRREPEGLEQFRVVNLPFEPRFLHAGAGGSPEMLIAVSAFGGQVKQFDADRASASAAPSLASHVGAVTKLGGANVLTQQTLDQTLPITLKNILGGNVMKNELVDTGRGLRIPLQREDANGERRDDQSADPAGIAFTKAGMLVCLSGVDEVWYQRSRTDEHPQRLPVGKRPRTIIARDDTAIVLGELDDTITRIETKDPENSIVTKTLLDPALANRELGPAERGERLFFDARMSAGGRMSCHSCHTDGHTNGLLADTLGDNTHGTPKRVLTLRGTRLTDLWAWNGEMKTLQDNVHKSLQETMHAPQIKPADVDDIVSFLHTLPPVPPLKPVPKDEADRAQVARGEKVFLREGCATCHVPPLTFTSHAVYDVGLADEKGLKKFNPPSLRGVGRLRKLFHDNRANSLRDVFETHGHQLAEPLPAAELGDLVRYLESL